MIKVRQARKGAVGNMLSCMLGLLIMAVVMQYGLSLSYQAELAVKKMRIERKYMFYMESNGYLTEDYRQSLVKELSDIGVTNIDMSGSTLTPAGYGNVVVLSVSGTISNGEITGIDRNWRMTSGDGYNFRIYQKSTAKY